MVQTGSHPQLPSGLRLGAHLQQRHQGVCGTAGPGQTTADKTEFRCTSDRSKMINDAAAPPPQVWVIADGVPGFPTETPGAVCHRLGVGPMKPKGQSWDYGIGVCLEPHSTILWSQNSELRMTSHLSQPHSGCNLEKHD